MGEDFLNNNTYDNITIPMIERMFASTISNELVPVQPLSGPIGITGQPGTPGIPGIFLGYLDYKITSLNHFKFLRGYGV